LPSAKCKTPRVQSQAGCASDRAATKADKLRKRLGWQAGILHGDGDKPKGKHWKTYQRLNGHHDGLVQVSLHHIQRKLGLSAQVAGGVNLFRKIGLTICSTIR
jgi:hypothetical protein